MRRFLCTSFAALSLALPLSAAASTAVTAQTTFAGVASEVRMSATKANTALTLQLFTPSGEEIAIPTRTNAAGTLSEFISGGTLQEAGLYTLRVFQGTSELGETTFTVLPATIDGDISGIESLLTGPNQLTVTVILRDRFGNPLANRTALLISSRSDDRIQALDAQTDTNGTQRFIVQALRPGPVALSAIDVLSSQILSARATTVIGGFATPTGGESPLLAQVIPHAQAQTSDIIQKFMIDAPKTVSRGDPFSIKITAQDSAGNTVPTYTGTIYISAPHDPIASLPGGIASDRTGYGKLTFLAKEAGAKQVSLGMQFATEGAQTIVVEDGQNPSIRGEISVTVSGGGTTPTGKQIRLTSPSGTVGAVATVSGIANPYSNILVEGGVTPVQTDTNASGEFTVQITVPDGAERITITASDESGTLKSASVSVAVDRSAPDAGNASLSPSETKAETNVLATIQVTGNAEDIAAIDIEVQGQTLPLTQNPVNPLLYQTTFAAPSDIGTYSVIFRVKDTAGNTSSTSRELTVTERGLPRVQNLRATSEPGAVRLTWNAPNDTVDSYRVLIASNAQGPTGEPVFDRSLDAPAGTTSAVVEGLLAGKTYAFAVAGVKNGQEGPASTPVAASPTGLVITVTPGTSDVTLTWQFPNAPQLLGYMIEYGASPAQKSEVRQVAAVSSVRIQDLLPRTYFFTITPIDISGKKLTQVATVAEGTPTGGAFTGLPGETVPLKPGKVTYPSSNASTGIPPVLWGALAALSATVVLWRLRSRKTEKFLRVMEARYRS